MVARTMPNDTIPHLIFFMLEWYLASPWDSVTLSNDTNFYANLLRCAQNHFYPLSQFHLFNKENWCANLLCCRSNTLFYRYLELMFMSRAVKSSFKFSRIKNKNKNILEKKLLRTFKKRSSFFKNSKILLLFLTILRVFSKEF
jgi:hypothetical protein